MAEFITRNISLLVSTTPESSFNTLKTAGSTFTRALMRGTSFQVPIIDKTSNADLIGTGFEFDTEIRNNYWTHPTMTVAMPVSTELGALWIARAFGGTNATPTLLDGVGGVVQEHTLLLQPSTTRQLPSSNLITSVGYIDDSHPGADELFAGVVPDSITISQSRADQPTVSVDLVGSGRFATPLPTGVRSGLPTTVDPQNYMYGAAAVITYNDGTAINLSADGRIRSWNFTFNNNLRRDDRRPGDPFRVTNDPTSGAYVNRLLRGPRTATAQMVVSLNEDLREWITHSQNRQVTNVSFLMKGELISGALTPFNYVVEVKLPLSYVRTITPTSDNDDAALTLDFYPVKGSGEYVNGRIVNKRATAIS